MYVLSPTIWSLRHGLRSRGFRGFVHAHIDTVGQAVGFFGERGGELIVPMNAIRRILIGFEPALSFHIHHAYIWYSGSDSPIAVAASGSSQAYTNFVRHLVRELERLDSTPRIELGTTFIRGIGAIFVPYGMMILLFLLMAANEALEDSVYSLLGMGRWGGAVFVALAMAAVYLACRRFRRWYRPRPYSEGQLDAYLPG